MSAGPHPFPPVVRWAVFPALAALAGAVGGLLAAAADQRAVAGAWAGIGAGMGAGGALGAMLSRRAWISLLAGPVLAVLLTCSVLALVRKLFWWGGGQSAFSILKDLIEKPRDLAAIAVAAWLPAAACHLGIRFRGPPSWPQLLAVYAGAGILAAAAAAALISTSDRTAVALLFFLLVAFQAGPFRASLSLAERLRRREP